MKEGGWGWGGGVVDVPPPGELLSSSGYHKGLTECLVVDVCIQTSPLWARDSSFGLDTGGLVALQNQAAVAAGAECEQRSTTC